MTDTSTRCSAVMLAAAGLLVAGSLASAAQADDRPIRIGVMNDMSGPYADFQGPGSVVAAEMAVEDYGGKAAGRKVEVISADHQNKPDVGAAIARKWLDEEGVDMIADLPNSAVALAVNEIVRDKNKALVASGAGTSALTGAKCSPNTVQWTYDTYSLGHALARAVVEHGGKSWYFITADYAFGHDLEKQAGDEVVKDGGKVIGSAAHPIGASDFSSYLLQAQSSGAQVVALANAGADETNTLKQASEFGIQKKQTVVGLIFGLQNVPALGQKSVVGLQTINGWYWNLNEGTRAFAYRYQKRFSKHEMPNDMQAGMYTAVLHYLKAVDKVGNAEDGKAVVDAMKAIPVDDTVYGKGSIRSDGRGMHPMYLLEVKPPEETKEEWDYFKLVATIPAEQAFRPLDQGGCPLAAK
jgi:branched-chain amino acid transport system substrate-binding protein